MPYKYICPTQRGYKRFYLSRQQHNQLFPNYRTRWYYKYEYYWSEHWILVHVFSNNWRIAAETLLFPLTVLTEGLRNTKEIATGILKLYNQKKSGGFHSYEIWGDTETYRRVTEVIQCQL